FESRTRPCLLFQIKRCSAPCVGRIDQNGYAELVREAEQFLSGKSRAVQELLIAEMTKAAAATKFEEAARLRDRIRAMSHIQLNQGINPSTFADADVFALRPGGEKTCKRFFFSRRGKTGAKTPFCRPADTEPPRGKWRAFLAGNCH